MGTDLANVKQNSYSNWGDGQDRPPRANRRGELVVCDFWTQLVLDGRMFHMQIGTESTPVNCTVAAADTLVWALVDGAAGTTYIPALWEVSFDLLTNATNVEAYFEIDRAKARWISGGTSYVPENMRTDRPRVSVAAAAYVGADITASAKTAVPGSIEIGHHKFMEDNITTAAGAAFHHYKLTAKNRPMGVIVGVGSMIGHFASGTTENDVTGFGNLDWAEIPTESVT